MSNGPFPRIVIVDDDEADTYVLRRAIDQTKTAVDVAFLSDGQAFVDFYCTTREQNRDHRHQIVLLDINMPILTGFDALETLGQMEAPRHTPIIIFSTSSEPSDVVRAYELGVNGYVKKPGTIEEAEDLITALHGFWLKTKCDDVLKRECAGERGGQARS